MPFNFNPDKELPNLDGKVVFLTGGLYIHASLRDFGPIWSIKKVQKRCSIMLK